MKQYRLNNLKNSVVSVDNRKIETNFIVEEPLIQQIEICESVLAKFNNKLEFEYNMLKQELLKEIRKERPNHKIKEVLDFKKSKHGFFNVTVEMEGRFFETKVNRTIVTIPYPKNDYKKLTRNEQLEWRFENC